MATIFFCSLAYLCQAFEFKKWEVPLGMVDGMMIQYLFVVVVAMLYYFSFMCLQAYVRSKFELYVPEYIMCKFIYRNLEKAGELLSNRRSNGVKKEINTVKVSCAGLKKNILKTIIPVVISGILCFIPFYMLFFIIVLNSDFISAFCLYVSTVVPAILVTYKMSGLPVRKAIKKIKKDIEKTNNDPQAHIVACGKIKSIESKIIKEEDKSNSTIYIMNITILVTTAVMFFAYILVHLYSPPKKDYWVYTDENGNAYVSVIENGDTSILKYAEIDGGNIKIFLDKQLYVKLSDKNLKHIKFDEVTIQNY